MPRRAEVRLRPRQGQRAARRGRLRGHRRRRRARDARRRPAAADALRRALGEPVLAADRRVHHRLAAGHRHRDDAEGLRRRPAHRGDRQGRLRHVRLGLDAVRRPRPDAVVLHVQPGQRGPGRPDRTTTTTRTCCDKEYDRLYKQQKVELDPDKRVRDRARDAHALGRAPASTTRSTPTPTCRRTGPTGSRASCASRRGSGPVLFSNTSPTLLRASSRSRRRHRAPRAAAAAVTAAAGAGGIIADRRRWRCSRSARRAWAVMRRRTADERE